MKWFIVYLAYAGCGGPGGLVLMDCHSGSYQQQMAMPSREVCEQIVRDNPNQSLACWAKPETAAK